MAAYTDRPVDADREVQTRAGPTVARRNFRPTRGIGVLALVLASSATLAASSQAASVGLGTADSFSVLGGSAVTNTGPTVLDGDLGVSPGTAISGFPPGLAAGAIHANDAVAQQAKSDLVTAYDDAAGRSSTATVAGDLAGLTLTSGVYTSATSLGLSGALTLDAQGDPDAVFVFQAGSTLTTATGSNVLLIGGAQACNVFWQVGSSATLGTATRFTGTIMALTSISLTTSATLDGRALARNGAVTLDTNVLFRSACTPPDDGTGGGTPGGGTPGDTGTPGGGTGTPGGGTGTPGADTPASGRPGADTPGSRPGSAAADRRAARRTGDRTAGSGRATPRIPRLALPRIITRPPTEIGCDTARLGGSVRPGAAASRYWFQFGSTRRYGARTAIGHASSRARARIVHALARGLTPGLTYHYRLVSVRPDGRRTNGIDRVFGTTSQSECRSDAVIRPPRIPPGFTG